MFSTDPFCCRTLIHRIPAVVVLAFGLSQASFANQDETPSWAAADPRDEQSEYRHYNRLLRTQLANLWAYVEGSVISRTVRQALYREANAGTFSTGMPGIHASVSNLSAGNTPADMLHSVLTQINTELRHNPQGKHFLITHGAYSDLNNFVHGLNITGMTLDKKSALDTLVRKIEEKAKINMAQIIADETQASSTQKKGAISVKAFSQPSQQKTGWFSFGPDTHHDNQTAAPDSNTIARRMESARIYTNWQDQLLRQTLAGAMVGAGIEAVITVTYKSVYEQNPPWAWDDSDTAEVATAAASGALTGAVSTAATWAIQGSYPRVPLWITSTIVTGSMHLLKESVKIALMREDALTVQQLSESMPATIAMSLGAYLGEKFSPVPLLGAIAGAITGRIAIGLAYTYLLQEYMRTPIYIGFHSSASDIPRMPEHISVGFIRPENNAE